MKILVTGAKGFVGKYLVEELKKREYEVVGIGREEWDVRQRAPSFLPRGIDIVVHCAALLMIDGHAPKAYFQTNAVGTYNVLEFCRENNAKMIYLMTHSDINAHNDIYIDDDVDSVYGGSPEVIAFIASKVAAKQMIEAYNRSGYVKGVILRLANIRGVGSKDTQYNCVFHQFIEKAKKGEPIELWGALKTIRDLIYVKDVVNAIILSFGAVPGIYNVGSGIGLTIKQEAEAIVDVFSPIQNRSQFIYLPDVEEVRKKSCVFRIDKARKEFGWYPKYSYVEAVS